MASFTAGTTFTDGVANDVTAAKLGALVTNATPTSGFIQDRTAETVIASNDTVLIGDASDSNNLKRMTVDNLMKAEMTGTINSTSGTIGSLTSTTKITSGTGTSSSPAISPTGDTNTGIFFPTADTIAFSEGGTESMRIDSSGNVGVGTTSPAGKLDVVGGRSFFSAASEQYGIGAKYVSTGGAVYFGAASSSATPDAVISSAGGVALMTLQNGGNVGIGTTSPSKKLQVDGNCQFGTTGSSGTVLRFEQDAGNGMIIRSDRSDAAGARYLAFGTDYNERLRIDSSGNVGVGTASPSAKLHVDSGAVANGAIFNSTNAVGSQFRMDNSGTAFGYLGTLTGVIGSGGTSGLAIRSENALAFASGGAVERLRIDSSGNVGIGTTSPIRKLSIEGGGLAFQSAGGTNRSVSWIDSTTTAAPVYLVGDSTSTGCYFAVNTNSFGSSGIERFRIDSSGNVGIGVTAPVNKLEVVGSFGRGAPVTKTGDFTLADTENWLIVNKGSSCTVTLPAASSWTGREFTIKVITAHAVVSASSNVVPKNSATAGTAILAAAAGNWATLVSNGTAWVIMCGS